ncbi:MAG: hypothetical protein OZ934_09435 [Anaerolineae bacterium]|nr:hypothetical protein [Anaerolineae bacterium]
MNKARALTHYTPLRPWLVVLLACAVYLGAIFAVNDADPLAFVTLGECFSVCAGADGTACPPDSEGYDGQFAYYIARDPVASPGCLDAPAYRLQRILLPALARTLSLGQTALIPWALVAINLAALVGGTALLEDLLLRMGTSRWYALSYGLFAGVFMAVRLSTAEPLAYGLALAAVWLAARERLTGAAILLALAALAKETTAFFALGIALHLVLIGRWRAVLTLALIAAAPFLAWQGVLIAWLGTPGVGSGGALATAFTPIPYGGVWQIALEGGLLVFLVLGVLLAIPAAVVPSLWGLWRAARDLRGGQSDLAACLLLANAAIMPFVPFSTYREFLGLLRFMPGLVIAVVWYAAAHRQRRALRYSTLWIVLIAFVIAG